jgi:beta-mannosidase
VISYRALHSGWTLTGPDVPAVPATVPGCVHTDLLAAGLIPDPFLDENETSLAWIGRSDWVYETTFTHDGTDDRVDLVCAGLDTVATVELNRVELGRTANMHRGYRFDVRLHPQDGLQLRLGLGPDAGHRRHLAGHRAAHLADRAAGRDPSTGDGRR